MTFFLSLQVRLLLPEDFMSLGGQQDTFNRQEDINPLSIYICRSP